MLDLIMSRGSRASDVERLGQWRQKAEEAYKQMITATNNFIVAGEHIRCVHFLHRLLDSSLVPNRAEEVRLWCLIWQSAMKAIALHYDQHHVKFQCDRAQKSGRGSEAKSYNETECWNFAYQALSEIAPEEMRRPFLDCFLTRLFERRREDLLLSFSWNRLTVELCLALDRIMRTVECVDLDHSLDVIHAFFFDRGYYRMAASVAWSACSRICPLSADSHVRMYNKALILARNALSQLTYGDQCFVYEDYTTVDPNAQSLIKVSKDRQRDARYNLLADLGSSPDNELDIMMNAALDLGIARDEVTRKRDLTYFHASVGHREQGGGLRSRVTIEDISDRCLLCMAYLMLPSALKGYKIEFGPHLSSDIISLLVSANIYEQAFQVCVRFRFPMTSTFTALVRRCIAFNKIDGSAGLSPFLFDTALLSHQSGQKRKSALLSFASDSANLETKTFGASANSSHQPCLILQRREKTVLERFPPTLMGKLPPYKKILPDLEHARLWKLLRESLQAYDTSTNTYNYHILVIEELLSAGMELPLWLWPLKSPVNVKKINISALNAVLLKHNRSPLAL